MAPNDHHVYSPSVFIFFFSKRCEENVLCRTEHELLKCLTFVIKKLSSNQQPQHKRLRDKQPFVLADRLINGELHSEKEIKPQGD